MKKTNILYWTFTGLFAAAMLFSGIANFLMTADSIVLFNTLGYPEYIIPFLGAAKIAGAVAILIPGDFPRLKEWAYAGLFFDLLGATYSAIMAEGLHPATAGMLIFFGLEALSYIYYHKRNSLMQARKPQRTSAAIA